MCSNCKFSPIRHGVNMTWNYLVTSHMCSSTTVFHTQHIFFISFIFHNLLYLNKRMELLRNQHQTSLKRRKKGNQIQIIQFYFPVIIVLKVFHSMNWENIRKQLILMCHVMFVGKFLKILLYSISTNMQNMWNC